MKLLGAFVTIFGLGTVTSSLFNYWIWYQLKESGSPSASLPAAERLLVEDGSHGFFLTLTLIGLFAIFGGFKLFRKGHALSQTS